MTGIPTHIICVLRGSPANTYENILLEDTVRISNGAFGVVYSSNLYRQIVDTPIKYTPPENCTSQMRTVPDGNYPATKQNNTLLSLIEFRSKCTTDQCVAIKKVHQDERYKNRELQILKTLDHPNVIKLQFYFRMEEKSGNHLCLIFDYFPLTIAQFYREAHQRKQCQPEKIKAIMYQIFLGIQYVHSLSICHRDIKPQNLLYNPPKGLVQIADFGSAKQLVVGQKSVSYICSRHYRAPELIFGQTNYTCSIDIWAVGCVMAEIILCRPIFPGDSNVGQLTEIIRIIGNPTDTDIVEMNHDHQPNITLHVKPITLARLITQPQWHSAVGLLNELLVYSPLKRITSKGALAHSYFSDVNEKAAFGSLSPIY